MPGAAVKPFYDLFQTSLIRYAGKLYFRRGNDQSEVDPHAASEGALPKGGTSPRPVQHVRQQGRLHQQRQQHEHRREHHHLALHPLRPTPSPAGQPQVPTRNNNWHPINLVSIYAMVSVSEHRCV